MNEKQHNITIRNATGGDSAVLHALAADCAPLTVHTPFTYWAIVFNYPDYIFILEEAGRAVGFISALPTEKRGGVFIWQIGLLPQYRGKGFSRKLIRALIDKHAARKKFIVTIDPDNAPSMSAFRAAAKSYGTGLQECLDPAFADDALLLKKDDNEIIFCIHLET